MPRPLLLRAFDGDPTEMIQDDGNRLGLRLIQLKMKRRGVYNGPIDGLYGPVTWAALAEVARSMRPDDPPDGIKLAVRGFPSSRHVGISLRLLVDRELSRSEG